jgi:hypothetical protein
MSLLGFRPSSRSGSSARAAKAFTNSSTTVDSQALPHSARGMAGVMDIEKSRTRRERTYINMECCVCEESLEYTLRGERILQLSCGHVSHEACSNRSTARRAMQRLAWTQVEGFRWTSVSLPCW